MIVYNFVMSKTKFEFESTSTHDNQVGLLEELYGVEGFRRLIENGIG